MTDPNTPTTPTNPQDLIDQALGTATTTVTPTDTTEPTLPTPEPLSPPPAAEPVVEQQKPEEVVAAPTIETVPVELTSEQTKPMGEDMPLAFATATPADTITTTPPEPYVEPVNTAVVPPILAAPSSPNSSNNGKGAMSKIKMAVVALLAVVGITGGVGLYAYQRYGTVQPATIAAIKDKDQDECSGCVNGGWLVWRDGQCKHTGICGTGAEYGTPEKDTPKPVDTTKPSEVAASCSGGNCSCGNGYVYCGGAISKCVSNEAIAANGGGCNKYGENVYNIPTTYGASVISSSACSSSALNAGGQTCSCGKPGTTQTTLCFDRTGICDQYSNPDVTGTNYNQQGLCATAGSYNSNGVFTPKEDAVNGTKFSCDNNGCTAKTSDCFTMRYTCSGTTGGNSCTDNSTKFIKKTEPVTGGHTGFEGKCGTVEQVDVSCGGYIASRTRINPECTEEEPTPSTPTVTVNPTLMCTGLTRTPTTTPAIGDKITFTCAGASTPAGAVSLNYKFRYSINSGNYVTLTNKTATTSELTIAQCGSYKVQCQACGTINGVLTCDPTWTGATAQ